MDVVLEIADTFLFDRIYANLLPISATVSSFDPISTIAASPRQYDLNASFPSAASAAATFADGSFARSGWQWQPASQFVSFAPSEYAYLSRWDRDNIWRQSITMYILTWFFGNLIYLIFASLSYFFVFDKTTCQHPKYLKNQIRLEMYQAMSSVPIIAIMTAPWFVLETRGYTFMYDTLSNPGFSHPCFTLFGSWYTWLQFPLFLLFTDCGIYWIHRGLHSKLLYKRIHKPHHKWIMPTPFASHAFHPLDGYAQSLPYHIFSLIFPLQKFAYLALFTFIQIWTVIIHDGEYVSNSPIINGAACHTMHHLYFNYNYGQFTTLWDRLGGSYRRPNEELFQKEQKMSAEEWSRQTKEMEKVVVEVEGKDDRTYGPPDPAVKKVQ